MKIKFHSSEEVKKFVKEISDIDCDINLQDGRIIVDAKSIMGVMNLDFSRTFNAYCVSDVGDYHDRLWKIIFDLGIQG